MTTSPHRFSILPSPDLPDPTPDAEIVKRVIEGETALFELLFRRHSRRIYRTMRVLNAEDADDAMQQAFISAYVHLGQFAGRASFATWLTTIATNEVRARLRRRRREWQVDLPEDDVLEAVRSKQPNPEEQLIGRELQKAMNAGIDSLPESYRSVLQLRQMDGLT
jgi:RNA polymerase sigma-70 factor, ECF subfamily